MHFKEYKEDYDAAPYALDEYAEGAKKVVDNLRLRNAAVQFLTAKQLFEEILEEEKIEIG